MEALTTEPGSWPLADGLGEGWADVTNPYDGSLVGRVELAGVAAADAAVVTGARLAHGTGLAAWERAEILARAAALVREHSNELAALICAEAGKPIKQAAVEAERAADTLELSAAVARMLTGEMVPLDATRSGAGRIGFTLRVPLGVIAAIAPFNFPLNLVAHKIGPALAAGNSVIVKPAMATPLSALRLAQLLAEADLPDGWLQVLPGSGSTLGRRLATHQGVDAISFTGSAEVGWGLRVAAPRKKVCLELGATSPVIVCADGNVESAAAKAAVHGFSYAGQSCISTQQAIVHTAVADTFRERLLAHVARLSVGDPSLARTDVGPVIDTHNRDRICEWIDEATAGGAAVLAGGSVNADGLLAPTVLGEPDLDHRVWSEEVFGPVVSIRTVDSLESAIELANESRYGLQVGVFTADVGKALQAARSLRFGGVLVNEVPTMRSDAQPYGGVRDSGNTREGPAWAVRELSTERFVSLG